MLSLRNFTCFSEILPYTLEEIVQHLLQLCKTKSEENVIILNFFKELLLCEITHHVVSGKLTIQQWMKKVNHVLALFGFAVLSSRTP